MNLLGRPPLPKEHGSWVMFLVAFLAGAIAAGRPGVPVLLFLTAALAVFVIRRPLAMRIRGEPRDPAGRAAVARWTAIFAAVGLAAGVPLLAVYRLWWLVPLGFAAAALLGVDLVRSARTARQTFWSELAGATGIPLVAAGAYYAATGALDRTAFALWAGLSLYYVSSLFNVGMKMRWVKHPPVDWRTRWETGWDNVVYAVFMPAAAVALAGVGLLPRYAWAALVPMAAIRFYTTAAGGRDTDFRRLGRNESIYSAVFLALFLTLLRAW